MLLIHPVLVNEDGSSQFQLLLHACLLLTCSPPWWPWMTTLKPYIHNKIYIYILSHGVLYWKSTRTATIIWQPLGEMTNSKINLELLRASESIHESTPMKLMPVWKLCQSERCVNMKHSECQDMVQSEWNKWMHELMKRTKVPCRSAIILYFNTKWGISDICSSPWLYYTIFFSKKIVREGNCCGKALNKCQWIILTYINHQHRHWHSQGYGMLSLIWCNESDNLLWSSCQKIRILF